MKHEIGVAQPEYLAEDWPSKYEVFSWLEYVVTVPNPIFLVTTRKAIWTTKRAKGHERREKEGSAFVIFACCG